MKDLTTFIIPTIDRPTLQRAFNSAETAQERVNEGYLPGSGTLFEIDRERIGEGTIRNRLIRQAKTEFVSMLDDDDTVTDDYVLRLDEELEKNPYADVVIFRAYFIQELMADGNPYPDHFIWQVPVVEWGQIAASFSVKRQVALDNPFISEPNEDFHFIKRLEEAGYNIHFSKYITYKVRH